MATTKKTNPQPFKYQKELDELTAKFTKLGYTIGLAEPKDLPEIQELIKNGGLLKSRPLDYLNEEEIKLAFDRRFTRVVIIRNSQGKIVAHGSVHKIQTCYRKAWATAEGAVVEEGERGNLIELLYFLILREAIKQNCLKVNFVFENYRKRILVPAQQYLQENKEITTYYF